jgi:hemerythrin-like domain-containing protein
MSETVKLLGRQHEQVLAHLAAVETEIADEVETDLADFLMFLQGDVADHFAIEEEALFPALSAHAHLAQGPLAVMDQEHTTFRQLVLLLSKAVHEGDRAEQRARSRDIVELLREHIAKEDHVLFPLAERVLTPEEQAKVDRVAAALGAFADTAA